VPISNLPIHPADLSPEQRHRELVDLLARAVLRLHERGAMAPDPKQKISSDFKENELANGSNKSVTVSPA